MNVAAVRRSTGIPLTVTVSRVPDDVPARFLLPPPARRAERQPMTVCLAFDLSGSMSGQPLREAQKAAHAFVSQVDLTTTAVGIIAFSDRVIPTLVPKRNAVAIGKAIDSLAIGETGGGNAGHPFDQLLAMLRGRTGRRYGVVLADGIWENQPLAIQRARRCHEAGIEIIAIGFGGADRAFLAQMASATENSFFTEMNELTEVFSTIARELTEGTGLTAGRGRGVQGR